MGYWFLIDMSPKGFINRLSTRHKILFLLLILLSNLALINYAVSSSRPTNVAQGSLDYKQIIDKISYSKIYSHVKALSSADSRVTGYEGFYEAEKYIYNYFSKELKLETITQEIKILSPIDRGTYIYVNGEKYQAYALWPNYIQTCYVPADNPLKGPLIYVGEGELKDFNGKKVEGSIVLMNFNTGKNWINAMKLGAKAVIFIAPSSTSFYEARAKILQTPVHFPRVYVSQKIGSILKGLANSGTEVSLSLNMKYEEVNAKNIIAVVPGSERPNDIIVIAAHYDTWSVVPALAPGADEAVSVSSLMELARYFSKHQPKLTIWFVALAGHWEALAGAREFVETFYFDESVLSGDQKIWAFMALDISTDLTKAALLYTGFFYEFYGGTITATDARFTRWLRPEVFNVILPALQQQTGRNYELENGFLSQWGWWASIYGPYMLDSEPFCIAHGLGFAFRTSSSRTRWGHPLTGIEQVSLSNLAPQLEMASAILYYLSEFGVKMDWYTLKPARTLYTAGGADVAGYITLPGKVMIYNVSRGWYDPMPNAIVAVLRGGSLGYSSYPFSKILVKADENGTFEVHGIGGVFAVSHSGWLGAGIFIEAYVIDDKTGLIEYAPDLGQWGAMRIPFLRNPDRHPFPVTTVVFKASSIVIFDISDPAGIAPKQYLDPRFESSGYTPWSSVPYLLQVLNFEGLSEYIMWGMTHDPSEDVAILFVPPNTRAMILYKLTSALRISGILVNATDKNPEGEGIAAGSSEQFFITHTAYNFAKNMFLISKSRYDNLRGRFIRNIVVEEFYNKTERSLAEAEQAFENLQYDKAYSKSKVAWIYSITLYNEVMKNVYDTLNVNILILVLFMPFILLFEGLVVGAKGRKKFLSITIVAAVFISLYYLIHPAPHVAANFWMSPLGISLEMLFIFVLGVFLTKALEITKKVREKVTGKHYMERPSLSIVFTSFNVGVRSMRRRKLRTLLTLSNIFIVTFSLIALTSVVPGASVTFAQPTTFSASYNGMFLRRGTIRDVPNNVIDPSNLDILEGLIPLDMSIRVWWYPQSIGGRSVYTVISSANGTRMVKAVLGLSVNEVNVTHFDEMLKEGIWFPSDSSKACILPVETADALGVGVGDTIRFEDYNLTVVGILDTTVANAHRDLDGYPMTPVNPDTVIALFRGFIQEEDWIPLSFNEIIIVPYKLVLERGGYISSLAFHSDNFQLLKDIARTLSMVLRGFQIYIANGNTVLSVNPVTSYGLYGWTMMIIPQFIGALIILNTMLASVKERTREIGIYSAVGVSPRDVGFMFLMETLTYALIAVIFGYVFGIIGNIFLVTSRALPPEFVVNASSLSTAIVLSVAIISTLIGSIYPILVASKIVTPSLERRWKIGSKPKGDLWEVPLPFSTPHEREVDGILKFLYEYFSTHTRETLDPFIVTSYRISLKNKEVVSEMLLQPIESGVNQEIRVIFPYSETERRFLSSIIIKRLVGSKEIWTARNYEIINCIRKQLLIWRGMSSSDREMYITREIEEEEGEV